MPPGLHGLISVINLRYEIEYNSQSHELNHDISEENQSYRVFYAGLSISTLFYPDKRDFNDPEGILGASIATGEGSGTPIHSSAVSP